MDESGSVGLDLSFVSYVLLLEPIADLSMEEQVISRAHRMGAKEPVRVGHPLCCCLAPDTCACIILSNTRSSVCSRVLVLGHRNVDFRALLFWVSGHHALFSRVHHQR